MRTLDHLEEKKTKKSDSIVSAHPSMPTNTGKNESIQPVAKQIQK